MFGYSVASAGDANGDGLDDVIVGAPYNSMGGTDAGRATFYLGASGSAFDGTADGTLTGIPSDVFGLPVGR